MNDPASTARLHLLGKRALPLAIFFVVAIAGIGYFYPIRLVEYDAPSDPNYVMEPTSQAVLNQKQALVDAYAQVGAGTMTMAQYDAKLDQFLLSHGITDTVARHPDHKQTAADCVGIAPANLAYHADGSCYDVTEDRIDPTATSMPSP